MRDLDAGNSGLLVSRSIASLTGASQSLMVANAKRKYLLIMNGSANNIGVNLLGGTAVIGGADTITLVPGGSYERDAGFAPQNAITIIGTSTNTIAAFEA